MCSASCVDRDRSRVLVGTARYRGLNAPGGRVVAAPGPGNAPGGTPDDGVSAITAVRG